MTTNTATYVPPTVQHAVTWQALTLANPSLQSWERSAATAGSKGLWWWRAWAMGSGFLSRDVREAIGGHDAPAEVFWAAMATAQRRVWETFEAARHSNQVATFGRTAGISRENGWKAPDVKSSGKGFRHD